MTGTLLSNASFALGMAMIDVCALYMLIIGGLSLYAGVFKKEDQVRPIVLNLFFAIIICGTPGLCLTHMVGR